MTKKMMLIPGINFNKFDSYFVARTEIFEISGIPELMQGRTFFVTHVI
jgi:hypothetical protein